MTTNEEAKGLFILLVGVGIVFALLCQFLVGQLIMMGRKTPQPPKPPEG